MKHPLALLLAMLTLGLACGPPPAPCGPSSCAGCCSLDGKCQAGNTLAACGGQGTSCTACASIQQCSGGQCSAGPPPDGGPCSLTDAGSPEFQCDAGATLVTLTQLHADVLLPDCALSGCHVPQGTSPTNYSTVQSSAATVGLASTWGDGLQVAQPFNLVNSTIWLKTLGGSPTYESLDCKIVGGVMPSGAHNPLSSAQLAEVKGWICAGAPAQ